MFVTPYLRSEVSGCILASLPNAWRLVWDELEVKEVEMETRPTDAMVGDTGAAGPAQDLQHQPPGRHMPCGM